MLFSDEDFLRNGFKAVLNLEMIRETLNEFPRRISSLFSLIIFYNLCSHRNIGMMWVQIVW